MASGILLGRNGPLKPPFQPRTSIGINRIPEKAPLDPEKLLNLGLDLTNTAKDKVTEACGLFHQLDWLARVNRTNLDDEDVATVLTDLREDAEVLLERGLYSLDVAQEVRARLRNHNPEHGEIITPESSKRWLQCFYALSGVWARAYIHVYGKILAAPTCGDLSHIPPKFHFDQPSREARTRYNNRLSVAVGARFPLVVDYWRCRLVKGIVAGELPGSVTLGTEVSKWPRGKVSRRERYGDEYSEVVGDNTYIGDGLAELAGADCTSFVDITQRFTSSECSSPKSPSLASEASDPGPPPTTPGATTRLETITEDSIDEIMGTPMGVSTPKNYPAPESTGEGSLQGPIAKFAQPTAVRTSRRLQEKKESKDSAPKEPEPPAPPKAPAKRKRETKPQEPAKEPPKKKQTTKKAVPTKAPAKKSATSKTSAKKSAASKAPTKRKRGAETAAQSSLDAPLPKRPRVLPQPMKLKLKATEGQDMSSLTDAEMAQLPWNKDKPAGGDVDPSKYVFPVSGYRPVDQGDLADIEAWAENRLPRIYIDSEDSEDEVAPNLTEPVESEVDDNMEVDVEEPTGAEAEDTRHALGDMPSQGSAAPSSRVEEVPNTPHRAPPRPEPVDSPQINTPQQFEDPHPTGRQTPPLPAATPVPAATSVPESYAPQPELPPHLRPGIPGIYKQFGPNTGIYSPNLNTSQFFKSSTPAKGATPKGPGASPSTPRRFTAEEASSVKKPVSEIGITTDTFLEGWSEHEEAAGGATPKPAGDRPSSPSKHPSGEETATPSAAKPLAGRLSSPRLPTPGGKPDTCDTTEPLGSGDGLFGSSYLEAQGLPKGPVSEAAEDQNAPSREPSPGAPKKLTPPKANDPSGSGPSSGTSESPSPSTDQSFPGAAPSPENQEGPRTPLNRQLSSSEPTTGASQDPPPSEQSEHDGSTYIDPQSRLHFPPYPPKSPTTKPAAEGEGGGKDPPSGGSGKSKASVSSGDLRAIEDAIQEDIAEREAKETKTTMKNLEEVRHDKALLEAVGIDPKGLSRTELRDTVKAMQVSAREAEERRNSAGRGGTDAEKTGEPKDAQKKESRKESEQKNDDATWRAKSEKQPQLDEDCDDEYEKEVWDI